MFSNIEKSLKRLYGESGQVEISRRELLAITAGFVLAPALSKADQLAVSSGLDLNATAELAKLCERFWEDFLKANPTWATYTGDKRYDHLLSDNSPKGRQGQAQGLKNVLKALEGIDPNQLGDSDRVTYKVLRAEAQSQLDRMESGLEQWALDPVVGPQVDFTLLADYANIETPADGMSFIDRCKAISPFIDNQIGHLRSGLKQNRVATREVVERVIKVIDDLLALTHDEWPLLQPIKNKHEKWTEAETMRFNKELTAAIDESVLPAFDRYRSFLKTTILPASRKPEKVGIKNIPGGNETYRKLIKLETTTDLGPDEIHKLGLQQIAEGRKKICALATKELGISDFEEIRKRLQNKDDPTLYFKTPEEIVKNAKEIISRSEQALSKWFNRLPKPRCEVREMSKMDSENNATPFYEDASPEISRPGYYYVNTSTAYKHSTWMSEVYAFHEAMPGHHLERCLALELKDLPTFRRHLANGAYLDGWALYAERLADEMGLYSNDLTRIGYLALDLLRSARLVVDTGIHHLGWNREKAIEYYKANTFLEEGLIPSEVDRSISAPAQVLAYKCGQLEVFRLRKEGEDRLGSHFDVKGFHDAVLRNGSLPLSLLRTEVTKYFSDKEKELKKQAGKE